VCWLAFVPLVLFALLALAGFAVTLLVDRAERRRSLLHPASVRRVFRPVLIQGGKAQARPAAEENAAASKIA
jgi:hypothetical protein